ncbi:MAG: hypothetical protein IPH88_13835 [Bacteroidales bacterium]|nr:hypothetical protein [Bacteroidales bacterium]
MANPEQQAQKQKELRSQFELVNEQKFMIDKMRAGEWKYFQQFDTIQKEAEDARETMSDEIEDLNKQREDCDNSNVRKQLMMQLIESIRIFVIVLLRNTLKLLLVSGLMLKVHLMIMMHLMI